MGNLIALVSLVGCAALAYTIYPLVLYPSLATHGLLGPTYSLVLGTCLQFLLYGFLAILAFRFLARLCPFTVSIADGVEVLHPRDTLSFKILLATLVLLINQAYLSGHSFISTCLMFDIVFAFLMISHLGTSGPESLEPRLPIVLFLRPFASFSDRSVLSTVLNALPRHARPVFLVPHSEPLLSRDPYSLALAGLRILEPLRSTPLALVAADDQWERCIRHLIRKSTYVVVDVTAVTPSLRAELDHIRSLRAGGRCIACIDERVAQSPYGQRVLEELADWCGVVRFRRVRRATRSLLALAITAFGTFGILVEVLKATPAFQGLRMPLLILLGVGVAAFWSLVFAKRGIGLNTARQLSKIFSPRRRHGVVRPAIVGTLALILLLGLYRVATTRHATCGNRIDIRSTASVILDDGTGQRSMIPEQLDSIAAATRWEMEPNSLDLIIDQSNVHPWIVSWLEDWDRRTSTGPRFQLAAHVLLPDTCSVERASLYLVIRSGPASGILGHDLRVLADPWPNSPSMTKDYGNHVDRLWKVQSVTIHETERETLAYRFGYCARVALIIAVPIVLLGLAYKTLKQ